jgi:hypothetical protein
MHNEYREKKLAKNRQKANEYENKKNSPDSPALSSTK